MTVDYILHIHVIMKLYFIMLHFINKSAFIVYYGKQWTHLGILYCCFFFVLFINTGYEEEKYQDYPDS
jgi:hypothetical protein